MPLLMGPRAVLACSMLFALCLTCPVESHAQDTSSEAGRITGVGGIFIKSPDPKALSNWYCDVLGIKLESWGGAALRYDSPGHPPLVTWRALSASTNYMTPSKRDVMLDFAVDDLDAFVKKLQSKGVSILNRDDDVEAGKFAWIMDPDGTKIELWEPVRK